MDLLGVSIKQDLYALGKQGIILNELLVEIKRLLLAPLIVGN